MPWLGPSVKLLIKLSVYTPVQPGGWNRKVRGKERLTPPRAERYVQHPKYSAIMVVDCPFDRFGSNVDRLRAVNSPDLIKVK